MKMSKYLLISLFGLLLIGYAGTSGKISGTIVDENQDPLIGVNVFLEGTSLGATTDENGYFVIVNVTPGVYDLKAVYIGYAEVTVQRVRVSMDLNTQINLELIPEVIAGEVVLAVADRPMIKPDQFASSHTISNEEIEARPVNTFMDVARDQAGVVGSHFRGGRTGEITILIDGMEIKDPAGAYSGDVGGFTSDIPEAAIQEMNVTLGGFGAEYGNVQSGVINLTTKEGSNALHGGIRFRTTNFGDRLNNSLMGERDKWFTTTYQHQLMNEYTFNLNGPLLKDRIHFALSGEMLGRDQGYFINQQYYKDSFQGKITTRLTDKLKLAVGGMYTKSEWEQFYFPASKYGAGEDYLENEYFRPKREGSDTLFHYIYVENPQDYTQGAVEPITETTIVSGDTMRAMQTFYVGSMQDYLWDRDQTSQNLYVTLTHTLSSKTYYQLKFQSYQTNYHYATKDIEDRDNDGITDEDLQWDIETYPDEPHPTYRERGPNNYWWVRGDDPGYRDQTSRTLTFKSDLVSQLTPNHMLKTGVHLNYYDIDVENISWTLGVGSERTDIWNNDLFEVGVYAQDKLEFNELVGLVGLRFDYFDPNGFGEGVAYPSDYDDPVDYFDANDDAVLNDPQTPTAKWQISPRVAISHPLTDRDVIRFTYGHYHQRPDAYYLYRNISFSSLTAKGNIVGNPDLNPEKTISYEVAVEHLFTNALKGVVNAYYKDVTDLMNYKRYVISQLQNKETNIYFNADYGNMKGMEFSLNKALGKYWGGSVSYSFSVAKGRSSAASGGFGAFTSARRMNILSFDQTHTLKANLSFISPEHLGFGLGNWRTNFQYEYGSGLPYSSYGTGMINDQRMPATQTTDMRLSKDINLFSDIKMSIILDIYNLFNNENVEWIASTMYYYQGSADDEAIKGDPSVIRREGAGGEFIRTPEVYSAERQFQLGIGFQF